MSSHVFTLTDSVDMNKEKDWAASIGMLDWDKTNIVFTKRSLIEFLKYTGVTVDTNLSNISKLPKYAKFGRLSDDASQETSNVASVASDTNAGETGSAIRPTRHMQATSGGLTSGTFDTEQLEDALPTAPASNKAGLASALSNAEKDVHVASETSSGVDDERHSGNRPSRRVREVPGGKDSLSELWGSSPDTSEFRPTRRVREGPGGGDTVGSLFGA